MTKLSVNINKVATLRNARGGDIPNVVKVALDCEAFGADGITVHPRPDERHIRRADVYDLRPLLRTEFNIEGYPSPEFIDLVLKVKPHQVTLVPDDPSQITSNSGWDTKANLEFTADQVAGLYLNIRYENGVLSCITGTSLKIFTLDKRLEYEWDETVRRYFKKKQVPFT